MLSGPLVMREKWNQGLGTPVFTGAKDVYLSKMPQEYSKKTWLLRTELGPMTFHYHRKSSIKPPSPHLSKSYPSLIRSRLFQRKKAIELPFHPPPPQSVQICSCFWSSAAWPWTSYAWAFFLCVLVLYGEIVPSSGNTRNALRSID